MAEFNQTSFSGGMNLLVDDTRIKPNQYREAFNVRNRNDVLEAINSSVEDFIAPSGLKQGLYTIGNYLLLFVAGQAWFRLNTDTGWQQIVGFQMSETANRLYVVTVPVTTTNYGRVAVPVPTTSDPADSAVTAISSAAPINLVNVGSAFAGSLPGILVQDGTNQAQFIYIDTATGFPVTRITQQYSDWLYDPTGVADKREYVPIGTLMAWFNGILFVVAPDGQTIYRSVSGRPLDFVVNIDPDGAPGGDATTTAYSVGVGNITCIRATANALFVSAGGGTVCFNVTLNTTPNAPTLFGEYTFLRQFLFNTGAINDRSIVDTLGDTVFISNTGLRSYNAILQQNNEGRNSIFSADVEALFSGILQNPLITAAIDFDNYSIFSVKTIYGLILLVWDELNQCYPGMDVSQTNYHAVKQFAKIESDRLSLFAITDDDRLLELYASNEFDYSIVRTGSFSAQNPKIEINQTETRIILNGFRQTSIVACATFVDNRLADEPQLKVIPFINPTDVYTQQPYFPDINSQLTNILYSWPNSRVGWKIFNVINWTGGGSITNIQVTTTDATIKNSLNTQAQDYVQQNQLSTSDSIAAYNGGPILPDPPAVATPTPPDDNPDDNPPSPEHGTITLTGAALNPSLVQLRITNTDIYVTKFNIYRRRYATDETYESNGILATINVSENPVIYNDTAIISAGVVYYLVVGISDSYAPILSNEIGVVIPIDGGGGGGGNTNNTPPVGFSGIVSVTFLNNSSDSTMTVRIRSLTGTLTTTGTLFVILYTGVYSMPRTVTIVSSTLAGAMLGFNLSNQFEIRTDSSTLLSGVDYDIVITTAP